MPATSNTRHAVSRATGTTTFVRPVKGVWTADCLNHKATATLDNHTAAWKAGSTPSTFCSKCKAITTGKAERVTAGLLDVPAAMLKAADAPDAKPAKKATPAPAKKSRAKKTTATTGTTKKASPAASKPATPAKKKETAAQRAARIAKHGLAVNSPESAAAKAANETATAA